MDLKEIIQTPKYSSEKEEDTPWIEDSVGGKPKEVHPAALRSEPQQCSGSHSPYFIQTLKMARKRPVELKQRPGTLVGRRP
jgi:hypothetical protein